MTDTPADRVADYLDAWHQKPHPTTRDLEVATLIDNNGIPHALTAPDLGELVWHHRETLTKHDLGLLRLQIADLQQARLVCVPCSAEVATGQRDTPNTATLIVNGNSACAEHVQFQTGPAIPGRTPSGLIIGEGN